MWTVEPLMLTIEEQSELARRVRAHRTAHRDRQRARVVRLAAGYLRPDNTLGLAPSACRCASRLGRCGHQP